MIKLRTKSFLFANTPKSCNIGCQRSPKGFSFYVTKALYTTSLHGPDKSKNLLNILFGISKRRVTFIWTLIFYFVWRFEALAFGSSLEQISRSQLLSQILRGRTFQEIDQMFLQHFISFHLRLPILESVRVQFNF